MPTPTPTPIPTPTPTPAPTPIPLLNPTFIYEVISNEAPHGDNRPNDLQGRVLRNGKLSFLGSDSDNEEFLAVSPRNKLLYAIALDTFEHDRLRVFTIARDGSFSEIASDSFRIGLTFAPMVFDPGGRFLFIASYDGLHEFEIDSNTDQLTEVHGSPFALGGVQVLLTAMMHPSGKYLYVDRGSGGIWGLAFDSATGQLTDLPGNPLTSGPIGDPTNYHPICNLDSSGNFLYTIGFDGTFQIYGIEQSGAIHLLSNTQNPDAEFFCFSPFDSSSDTAYFRTRLIPLGGDVVQFNAVKINPDDGSLVPIPGSLFSIFEDAWLSSDPNVGHVVSQIIVRETDRTAIIASEGAIYIVQLGADGTPQLPPLTHFDVADGVWDFVDNIAANH